MTKREKELLNTLYHFYYDADFELEKTDSKDIEIGDGVIYKCAKNKHNGKKGIFFSVREKDKKCAVKFEDGVVLWANFSHLEKDNTQTTTKKVKKNPDRLLKHIEQMVSDGDLSRDAANQFLRELEITNQLKEEDPYGEDDWEEEKDFKIIKKETPKRKTSKQTKNTNNVNNVDYFRFTGGRGGC